MAKHYKDAPWYWYVILLVVSFILGLVVVIKENITLPAWAYVVALLLGTFIAPFVSLKLPPHIKCVDISEGIYLTRLVLVQSTILYARFGNGIATNNLSKMLAGLMLPGKPVGNMYFAAWSHNVISNAVNLSNDLKLGEYRKFSRCVSSVLGVVRLGNAAR